MLITFSITFFVLFLNSILGRKKPSVTHVILSHLKKNRKYTINGICNQYKSRQQQFTSLRCKVTAQRRKIPSAVCRDWSYNFTSPCWGEIRCCVKLWSFALVQSAQFTFDDSCKVTRLVPLNLDIIFLTASPQLKTSGTYSFVHHHKHSENTPQRHKVTARYVIFKAVKQQVTEKCHFPHLQDQK